MSWRLGLVAVLVGAATLLGTWHLLGRLRPGSGPGEGQAVFLAHVLLPLSVALSLIVALVLVAAALRVVAALRRRRDPGA